MVIGVEGSPHGLGSAAPMPPWVRECSPHGNRGRSAVKAEFYYCMDRAGILSAPACRHRVIEHHVQASRH